MCIRDRGNMGGIDDIGASNPGLIPDDLGPGTDWAGYIGWGIPAGLPPIMELDASGGLYAKTCRAWWAMVVLTKASVLSIRSMSIDGSPLVVAAELSTEGVLDFSNTLVHMMYSTCFEYGFRKLKAFIASHTHFFSRPRKR